jgi:hypothetical protein
MPPIRPPRKADTEVQMKEAIVGLLVALTRLIDVGTDVLEAERERSE